MGEEQREGWRRWEPSIAEATGWEDLAEAVEAFEPPCNEAGEECAEWLKKHSLADHRFTTTWVLFHNSRVHAFFAICSSSITVTSTTQDGQEVKETWPCSQIKWLCKHIDGKFLGRSIFEQAVYRAQQVGELQGNVALVIEPFDDTIAELLRRRFPFLRIAGQGQLWTPLYPDQELAISR